MKKSYLLVAIIVLALGAFAFGSWHSDIPVEELIGKYTNDSSRFIDVDGVKVHYRDDGRGPTLVLIHGMNSSLHTWEGWVEELGDEYRVISLDMPGFGLTGPDPKKRYSPAQAAEFLGLFLRALGVGHFSLAGNSLGGSIAWHFAVRYSEKVDKLILVDSAGMPRDETRPFLVRLQAMPLIKELFAHITPRWIVSNGVHEVYGDPSLVTDAQVQRYFELLLREGNRRAAADILGMSDDRESADALKSLKVPTLILWGEKDVWILPKYAERFREYIPHAELITYPKMGHIPMEENPGRTAGDVRKFLSQPADRG